MEIEKSDFEVEADVSSIEQTEIKNPDPDVL
jgi:hypothetical protein